MAEEPSDMVVRAIGTVRNEITRPQHRGWEQAVSEIVVDPRLSAALEGLEGFSHIIVLFWMNRLAPREMAHKVHPRGDVRAPLVGFFATRSPYRPNPIGMTVVSLLERRDNVLEVAGLDAISGTPLIDIKPYIPRDDIPASAEVPSWVIRSHEIRFRLEEIYRLLAETYGPQHWWPAENDFEMMTGAILTQSAAWKNVEAALANLKAAGALSPAALRELPLNELAGLIRPSGYYNAKAAKLKALAQWLKESCDDDLGRLFARDTDSLRRELLAVHGIGPETADSILLYAGKKPVFVIDAYTRRILERLGIRPKAGHSYADYQAFFMDNLAADARYFNEYHALLVCLGKNVCRPRPRCAGCCLREICPFCG